MSLRNWILSAVALVAVCGAVAFAQVGSPGQKAIAPKEVTLTGKVVDLQNFMTEKFASSDHKMCTQTCIRAGVPVALETTNGLYILSQGEKGASNLFAPFAFERAEVKGKLYEKHGVKYIDVTSATKAPESHSKM